MTPKEFFSTAERIIDAILNGFVAFLSRLSDSPFTLWVVVLIALFITYLIYW